MIASLSRQWAASGVEPGDALLIHSSLKRTLQEQGVSPAQVLQSLLDAVGPGGTLVLPLFNFDFASGKPFDIRSTKSSMGALSETARIHSGAVRSGHPIYSFVAIGANASRFNVDNYSGYGADSPFGILRELNGKIAVLDIDDQGSMTFYHHVEEMNAVDYRFHKEFTGSYVDVNGECTERAYAIFVRDLERAVVTHVNPMGELLWRQGLYFGNRPHEGSGLRTICCRKLFESVAHVIQDGRAKGLLYITKPEPEAN